MKKTLSVTMILLFLGLASTEAQNCSFYFPTKEGTVLESLTYESGKKPTGSNTMKILKKEGNANSMSVTAESESKDLKDAKANKTYKSTVVVKCEKGEFYVNMNNYFDQNALAGYQGMDIKVEAQDMKIPAAYTVGQSLGDGSVNVIVSNSGFKLMTMTVKVLNRKVEKEEKITTPAGTFDCVKITYDVQMKLLFNVKMKGVEWIAKEVGVVRSETLNEKGKLQSYTILNSIK